MRDWKCCDENCRAWNRSFRVACRLCKSPRAAFHPDPEIDDGAWKDYWDGAACDVAAGLIPEPPPNSGQWP